MFKIILYGFLLYLLYKFIFELVIPVSKATSQVKSKMREMQEMQNAQQEQYRQQQAAQAQAQPQEKKKGGDYIEFEEVK
jgi:sortase (surface protein transpeptidase)